MISLHKSITITAAILLVLLTVPGMARAATDTAQNTEDADGTPDSVEAVPTVKPATPKGNWVLTAGVARPKKLQCTQKLMIDRIRCRLTLNDDELKTEYSIQYLPEDCRVLAKAAQASCVAHYKAFDACSAESSGADQSACAAQAADLTSSVAEAWNACQEKSGKAETACEEAVRQQVYTKAKLAVTALEKKAEATRQPGADISGVVAFENTVEGIKQKYNKAKTAAVRIQLVNSARNAWKQFVKNAGESVDAGDALEGVLEDFAAVK